MRKWWINGLAMLLAGAMTVFAAGCGDDDKGNNSSGLTEEEQYEQSRVLMMAAPSLVINNFGSQFWDGVDQEDFVFDFFGLGKLVPTELGKRIPGILQRPTLVEADTVILVYSEGWWRFHVEFDFDSLGFGATVLIDDSVRFETEAGIPHPVPDENTLTFIRQGDFVLELTIDLDSLGSYAFATQGETDLEVVGLNDTEVVVNGETTALVDFDFDNDSIQGVISAGFSGDIENIIMANEIDACPDDGTITLGFDLDIDVTTGGAHAEASGDWEVHVDLLGDGAAHIEVHSESGDFEAEENVDAICEPPLEL